MASFAVKVIRGAFGIAEHVMPAAAGRLAFELFCRTADPVRLSEGEQRAVDRAASLMVDARRHRLTTRAGTVMAFVFKTAEGAPAVGTVLLVHGWHSRSEHMRVLIDGFRDRGYRVVSLDLPGHGHSSGRRLNMALAVDAIATAAEWFGPFSAIVGHSFGGAAAVNAAVGSVRGVAPVATDRLVLISAPNSMPKLFEMFGGYFRLGPRTRAVLSEQVRRITGRKLSEFVCSMQLARLPVPTLVMHADEDREVPSQSARELKQAGDHVTLRWANGLGHRRILTDPGVVGRAVDFVAEAPELALAH